MAHFEIVPDEYTKWNRIRGKRTWRGYVVWGIALAVLVASLFLRQFAFSVLWAALLVLVYLSLSRGAPTIQARQMRSPFAFGPFDVALAPDCYTIRVGSSELKLSLHELGYVHDFGDHYRLDHESGSLLYLPKRALSEEEARLVETYRRQHPGLPDRKPWKSFSESSGITRA